MSILTYICIYTSTYMRVDIRTFYMQVQFFRVRLSFASRFIAIIYNAKYDYPLQIKTVNKSINLLHDLFYYFPWRRSLSDVNIKQIWCDYFTPSLAVMCLLLFQLLHKDGPLHTITKSDCNNDRWWVWWVWVSSVRNCGKERLCYWISQIFVVYCNWETKIDFLWLHS